VTVIGMTNPTTGGINKLVRLYVGRNLRERALCKGRPTPAAATAPFTSP
jgi:hypothetical protein